MNIFYNLFYTAKRLSPYVLNEFSACTHRLRPCPNVLAIHTLFPPDQNTGSYRCSTIAKIWSKQCATYSVLTTKNKTGGGKNYINYCRDRKVDSYHVYSIHEQTIAAKARLVAPYHVYGPDLPQAMIFAWAALKIAQHTSPDIIFTSGPLFSDFIAAFLVSATLDCALALDYRDEWTIQTPPFIRIAWMSRFWERKCLNRASSIFFVTEQKRTLYRNTFPLLKNHNCHVIPQGWNSEIPRQPGTHQYLSVNSDCIMSFIGHPTPAIPIKSFILSLRNVARKRPDLARRLILKIVGRCDDETRRDVALLDGIMRYHIHQPVPHHQAVGEIENSHILILLNNVAYPGVTPLKFYDYMASDRPILVWGAMGNSGDVINSCKAGIVVDEYDIISLESALDLFLITPFFAWETEARKLWREQNSTEQCINRMISCINNDSL